MFAFLKNLWPRLSGSVVAGTAAYFTPGTPATGSWHAAAGVAVTFLIYGAVHTAVGDSGSTPAK